jgi:Ca2+-binding RTX toxin-like protein
MSISVTVNVTDDSRTDVTDAYGVVQQETRNFDVRIFAPDAAGDYPVVFWSGGHLSNPANAMGATNPQALADQGFIVLVATHLDSLANPWQSFQDDQFPLTFTGATTHRVADVDYMIDNVATLLQELPAGYTGDTDNLAIGGHSHGAFIAALMTGADSSITEYQGLHDTRLEAAILVSPQGATGSDWTGFSATSWNDHTTPTLVVTGTEDNATDGGSYLDRLDIFEFAPSGAKHAIVIQGADHGELGNEGGAITATLANTAGVFLDGYVSGVGSAVATLSDVETYRASQTNLREVYERAVIGQTGSGTLVGGSSAETLTGSVTNDTIVGAGGADTLIGNGGVDSLRGGAGADWLIGGAGNDLFDFNALSESTAAARDTITDFSGVGAAAGDRIDVSTIDARNGIAGNQAFTFIGTGAFTGSGQIRAVDAGADVRLLFNTDGNLATIEMEILIQNIANPASFTASDFIL